MRSNDKPEGAVKSWGTEELKQYAEHVSELSGVRRTQVYGRWQEHDFVWEDIEKVYTAHGSFLGQYIADRAIEIRRDTV